MGRDITCGCGQLNRIDAYVYGEPRYCVACGRRLSETGGDPAIAASLFPEEAFPADPFAPATGEFESPPPTEEPSRAFESPGAPVESEPESPAVSRAWQDGIREHAARPGPAGCCARCQRPFRGAWDVNQRPGGDLCHICATQADRAYAPPSENERRTLYRPDPPRTRPPEPEPGDSDESRARKKREILVFVGIAAITLLLVNVLPVETWVAMFFSAAPENAADLPRAWIWVIRTMNFGISVCAHAAALYLALHLIGALDGERFRDDLPTLAWLGVVFTILNLFVNFAGNYFGMVFGPVAGILMGLALLVSLMIKLLLIANHFPARMEGAIGFLMCWAFASLLLKPCVFVTHRLFHGLIAAIAL